MNHSAEEYVRAYFWHTNTAENYFSILKRGIYGCYFHVSEAHLHRYTAEFDFRHNNRIALGVDDLERADRALIGAKGKRLTYATPRSQSRASRRSKARLRKGYSRASAKDPRQLELSFDEQGKLAN